MQEDLELLYVSFKLAARHLHDLMPDAEPKLTEDLGTAKAHLLQAVDALASHIDANNISILRQSAP